MKFIFTHTLSILVAMMLLFVMVAPGQAATSEPNPRISMDTFTDDTPPTPETEPTIIIEQVQNPPVLNLAPTFNFWYGSNQTFGQKGNPQRQINILGNISRNGESITTLRYTLNDKPEVSDVPVAPSASPRLINNGDFNIALNIADLKIGTNNLLIKAGTATVNFQFKYSPSMVSLPYAINWNPGLPINSQAQVVDGLWEMTSAGPRTKQIGYDRVIAIGDMTWKNYEVTVPFTVHNFPDAGEGGVGIIGNWVGHGGDPSEPLPDDWWLMGAYGYYSNKIDTDGSDIGGLAMYLNQTNRRYTTKDVFRIDEGVTYLLKMRVEQVNSEQGRYSLKAWRRGQPEPAWSDPTFSKVYNVLDTSDVQTNGGILFGAHRADVTFGNVAVCPLTNTQTYTLSVNVSGQGSVSKSPNKSQFACGEEVRLSATAADGWRFVGWTGDVSSSSSSMYVSIVKPTSLTAVFQQTGNNELDQKVFIPLTTR